MPSLRDKALDGDLCTFSTRTSETHLDLPEAPDSGIGKLLWYGPSVKTAWTIHHNTNLSYLDPSPQASQAGLFVGSSL